MSNVLTFTKTDRKIKAISEWYNGSVANDFRIQDPEVLETVKQFRQDRYKDLMRVALDLNEIEKMIVRYGNALECRERLAKVKAYIQASEHNKLILIVHYGEIIEIMQGQILAKVRNESLDFAINQALAENYSTPENHLTCGCLEDEGIYP